METMRTVDDAFVNAIEDYKAGDREAFNYIYEHSSARLGKYAFYLTGNREDAEDLLQDTYLRIMEKSRSMRDAMAFFAWARTIMYNLFITSCRKNAKEFACEDDALNAFLEAESADGDPEEITERSEVNKTIDTAVDSLTAAQQEVIRDFYYNGKPVKWIASESKTSENTIKTRLFYARCSLKKALYQFA